MGFDFKSITEIFDAYDSKKCTPLELTQHYLDQIKQSQHNAFLTVCAERAVKQAQAATEQLNKQGRVPRDRVPLFGIPMGLKDIFTLEGVRTTCASKILENYVPPYTATLVSRLEQAGAITLGKLNMDEFAMGGSNENSAFGPVKHPTHPDRVPGGSSGGSATAVAAGLCAASMGTDTGGSIRLPASFTGVVGLKPTYGRVSRYGMIAFASSLDQAGPLTQTVEDSARVLQVIAGKDELDSTSSPKAPGEYLAAVKRSVDCKRLRIGVPREFRVPSIEPAIEYFAKKGAQIVDIDLPHSKYAVAVYYVIAVSEASSNLSRYDGVRYGVRPAAAAQAQDLDTFYRATRALFGPEVKRRILLGTFALSSGYYDAYFHRACQVRRLISEDFKKAFESVDVILSPVAAQTAFKLGERSKDPLQMYLTDLYTIPASLAGLPAMSVPYGRCSEGLPIGVQLVAPAYEEERLLCVASELERGAHAS